MKTKKITIEFADGQTFEHYGTKINMLETSIHFDNKSGTRTAVNTVGAKVTIEETDRDWEGRTWTVVCGKNTGSVWAQNENTLFSEDEVEMIVNLTEDEARELADNLRKKIDTYRF